jgi:hypothetical protein
MRDAVWVGGGELEGIDAAAAVGEKVDLLGTKAESGGNSKDVACFLDRIPVYR